MRLIDLGNDRRNKKIDVMPRNAPIAAQGKCGEILGGWEAEVARGVLYGLMRAILANALAVTTYRNSEGVLNNQRMIKIKAAHKAAFAAK